jgi:hypothetical protein
VARPHARPWAPARLLSSRALTDCMAVFISSATLASDPSAPCGGGPRPARRPGRAGRGPIHGGYAYVYAVPSYPGVKLYVRSSAAEMQ